MSVQNNQAIIGQFTQQKSACEAELQKINVELGISNNNLQALLAQAQEQFGTQDPAMLNQLLTSLTVEYDTLSTELNSFVASPNNGVTGY